MATSKLFKKVPVTVPGRSGFNMSHNNFFSAPVGTLVPNLVDFLLPGDEVDLSSKSHIQLPPMATDFYGRVEYKEEAFFVPCRILFGGWKDFYVNPVDGTTNPSNIDGQLAKYLIGAQSVNELFARTLKLTSSTSDSGSYTDSIADYGMLTFDADSSLNNFDVVIANSQNFENAIIYPFTPTETATGYDSGRYYYGLNMASSALQEIFAAPETYRGYFNNAMRTFTTLYLNNYFNYIMREADRGNFILWNGTPSSFDLQLGPGTLADYLGFKVQDSDSSVITPEYLKALSYSVVEGFISILNSTNLQGYTAYDLFKDLYERQTASSNETIVFYGVFVGLGSGMDDTGDEYLLPIEFGGQVSSDRTSVKINNILPFMAYHKIYDDWYRAPMIQQSLFKRNVANQSTATTVANMPWITSGAQDKIYFSDDQLLFANGHSLFDLHQRNWQKDYYTSATPEPQAGDASSVKFDVVNDSGEFTIASLRAANALQQWLDRNNIGGFRYGDMIYAQYGVYPSDATTDRAIYLGSSSVEVYNKSIYQHDGNGGENTNNPFNAIGSKYASPSGVGDGNFCNNYAVTEAGFLMKIGSLVPQAYYGTGVRRMFNYNDISDIAFPVLAGVGDQPIYGRELTDVYSGVGDDTVFGYQQRYAEYKFIDDQVHGLLRDGQSLASFALQRSFASVPELGSSFLEIPRDYLDQVSATDYKLSQYGCWVNCYNDYRKSSKLPAYSIPTLEDMKGYTVLVDKSGKYLA